MMSAWYGLLLFWSDWCVSSWQRALLALRHYDSEYDLTHTARRELEEWQ